MSTENMSLQVEVMPTPSASINNVPYTPPSPVDVTPQSSVDSYSGVYDEVFPALPETEVHKRHMNSNQQQVNHLGQGGTKRSLKSSVITKLFIVPLEERRFQEFGHLHEQGKICAEIMQATRAHIEVSSSKDGGLTFLLTGKEEEVLKAMKRVQNELQTQAYQMISIPKEHHCYILGKKGQTLLELEKKTMSKITVPRLDENSDQIKITGTKEAIDKARHEIQKISDEKANQCREKISIPKEFHIFITGAFKANVHELQAKTNTKIYVPSPSDNKDEITILGDRESCQYVKSTIEKIYLEKKKKCQVVMMEVKKSQHKYVYGKNGNGIQEIFQKTGVSVEMPSSDETSETIRLRGEQVKMGAALTLVNERANSSVNAEVVAPAWLHKYIIGKKGVNITEKTKDLDKVQIDFKGGLNKILLEGPKDQVEEGQSRLEELISSLMTKLMLEEIRVDPQHLSRVLSKHLFKIKKDIDVQIYSENNNVIKIEGSIENVTQAKKILVEIIRKIENETTKELIIDQCFHRNLIGTRGEKIKETREKFPQVNITFPDPGSKSDIVSLRGPKEEVEGCYGHLSQLNKTLLATMAKAEVPIYKQFHKFIIGKGGSNIQKIRLETETNIDLPVEGSDSDLITITGKKDNVLAAQERILAIQNELANIVQVDIIIPAKFHTSLIGPKGRLIRSIREECGGVTIHFPLEKSGSDKVTIRGPKDDVQKAKKILVDLSNEKQESNFTAEVKAKPDHIKFLIGKNGANVKRLKDKTGARIIFPSEKDEEREAIIILGKKDEVNKAKKELEDTIRDLDKVAEIEFRVDPKHYRHFVSKKGEILNQIAQDFGKVTISFPRIKENSDIVKIKGSKDCVYGAKARIEEIVQELDSWETVECIIPQKHHRKVMGAKGSNVQGITQEFNVQIKFPDKDIKEGYQNGEEITLNGGLASNDENEAYVRTSDIIYVTGKKENCAEACKALMELVPINEKLQVPYDFHKYIIGQKGKDVRELMENHQVNIMIPPANDRVDLITISGPPSNVQKAIEAIKEKVKKLEAEQHEKALRNFQLRIEVDPSYHPKIIGKKGLVINEIRTKHDVQVQFADSRDDPTLTITGYEANAMAAKDAILRIVHDLDSRITKDINLDSRVFSRLIGYRGCNIRKIMKNYEVEIKLPKASQDEDKAVVVVGLENNVERVIDYLRSVESEHLQSIQEDEETQQYIFKRTKTEVKNPVQHSNPGGFIVKDAPWDMSNTNDFPSIGSSGSDFSKPTTAWGPQRR